MDHLSLPCIDLVRKLLLTLIWMAMVACAFGQLPSRIYDVSHPESHDFTDADVYAMKDGNVMVISQLKTLLSDRGFNRLLVQEFDSCGLLEQRVLTLSRLFGIRFITDFAEQGDSIYIVGQGNPLADEFRFAESFVITLDRKTFKGRYTYFRSEAGSLCPFNIKFIASGGFAMLGYLSSTTQTSQYYSLTTDRNSRINVAKQFIPSFTFTGEISVLHENRFLIKTSEYLFAVDSSFNVVWTKKFDRPISGERSIVTADGIVMAFYGWYGESELQVLKINFVGEVMWSSPRLNQALDLNGNMRLLQKADGTYVVINQSYDFNEIQGIIEITELNAEGQIIGQFGIDLTDQIEEFNALREATIEANYLNFITSSTDNQQHLFRYNFENDICGIVPFSYDNNNMYEWLFPSSQIVTTPFDIATGSYDIGSGLEDHLITEKCVVPYPLFDILPADTAVCDGFELGIDLSQIDAPIFWSDGSEEVIRKIDTAGTFLYGYGKCQENFAEMINVDFEDCSCHVYIPTAFSPNNDGINDVFRPYSNCDLSDVSKLQIFDRWGNLIFDYEANGLPIWDGATASGRVSAGVYVYQFEYLDIGIPNPQPIFRQGEIHVIE